MYHTLYAVLVLTINPTIPADLKALGDGQYNVREAATKRLEKLPGWTVLYFKHRTRKTHDPEIRIRCARVHEKLDLKWSDDLLKWKADLVLALFPTIPADLKALEYRQDYRVREAAMKRLESLPGYTAPYFKYHAGKTADPERRVRYEAMYKTLDSKWRTQVTGLWLGFQFELSATMQAKKYFDAMAVNLSKLSAEDLKLVGAQGNCPIREDVTLGAIGVPVKIILKGQPVFLCCKECIKKAQTDPEKTLAKLKDKKWNAVHSWWLKEFIKAHIQNPKQTSNSPNFKK